MVQRPAAGRGGRSAAARDPARRRGLPRPTGCWSRRIRPSRSRPTTRARPIHYVIRPDHAPPDSEALVHQAVSEVSAATGLRFAYGGLTEEAPSNAREAYQPDVYGKRWAPVLIAWSSPAESPRLAGDVAGLGGSATVKGTGTPYVHVSGQIELDGPDLAETLVEPSGRTGCRP